MPCWQQDSLLLTGPGIYPQVYHRNPCPAVLICKGVFFISYGNQVLLGIISQCGSLSCTLPKNAFLSPSVCKKKIYLETKLKGEFTELFWKLPKPVPCSNRQSKNMMMNTFIKFNITPYVRDSLEDEFMLVHFRKAFTSLWDSFERRAYCLLLCFESYTVNRGGWTLW